MGRFVNFLGGMNIEMLPVSNIGGILFNTPDILKAKFAEERIKDIIKRARPGYTMVDSGGYQAFKVKENNRDVSRDEQTRLIMNENGPIYGKKTFNLTAKHVLDAVLLIGPDFVISPDIPVPVPVHPDQKRFLFLESLG
jgi:queuine/archaeosine tRNA-ribosyltransferase